MWGEVDVNRLPLFLLRGTVCCGCIKTSEKELLRLVGEQFCLRTDKLFAARISLPSTAADSIHVVVYSFRRSVVC